MINGTANHPIFSNWTLFKDIHSGIVGRSAVQPCGSGDFGDQPYWGFLGGRVGLVTGDRIPVYNGILGYTGDLQQIRI